MLPDGIITSTPFVSNFLNTNLEVFNPLKYSVMGSMSLIDPSKGRLVKKWIAEYSNGNITVKPEDGPIVFTLPQSDVKVLSLAFTTNMDITLAWVTSVGIKLYYFNSLTSTYITREFIGPSSCLVCVDKADLFYSAESDVILSYTLNGKLYYRQQRDRYDTEYLIGTTNKLLMRAGPNVGNRLQFELVDKYPELPKTSNVPILLTK